MSCKKKSQVPSLIVGEEISVFSTKTNIFVAFRLCPIDFMLTQLFVLETEIKHV